MKLFFSLSQTQLHDLRTLLRICYICGEEVQLADALLLIAVESGGVCAFPPYMQDDINFVRRDFRSYCQ